MYQSVLSDGFMMKVFEMNVLKSILNGDHITGVQADQGICMPKKKEQTQQLHLRGLLRNMSVMSVIVAQQVILQIFYMMVSNFSIVDMFDNFSIFKAVIIIKILASIRLCLFHFILLPDSWKFANNHEILCQVLELSKLQCYTVFF